MRKFKTKVTDGLDVQAIEWAKKKGDPPRIGYIRFEKNGVYVGSIYTKSQAKKMIAALRDIMKGKP